MWEGLFLGWEFSMSPLCPPDLKWKMEGPNSGRTNIGQSKVRRQTQLVTTKLVIDNRFPQH